MGAPNLKKGDFVQITTIYEFLQNSLYFDNKSQESLKNLFNDYKLSCSTIPVGKQSFKNILYDELTKNKNKYTNEDSIIKMNVNSKGVFFQGIGLKKNNKNDRSNYKSFSNIENLLTFDSTNDLTKSQPHWSDNQIFLVQHLVIQILTSQTKTTELTNLLNLLVSKNLDPDLLNKLVASNNVNSSKT